ncbi:E3 ubiquitin-protein ligase RNF115 [Amphibalanus amphitrite]|uniref:RING-type E3 ubiquitin transferase n=1 Tax=Amphibalanus amphitrite TaxID=1232801 RepID=A0A6A4UYL0_AMPAM|nr:E3 ubiquitin-protein ligase RNF115 [Amphibalanus amphitrite]
MAEASGAATTDTQYFCHICNKDITPVVPEYTCPDCQGGFIEQRDTEDGGSAAAADDPEDELPPLNDPAMHAFSQLLNIVPLSFNSPLVIGGRNTGRGAPGGAANGSQQQQLPQAGGFVELLDNLFANFHNVRVNVDTGGQVPIHFRLHGNPGDYAWGNAELDRIVTQLLNQLDSSGPPPLGQALIQRLPTVTITQASVDANLQCMVCFEDYKLDEKVRELPCSHLYHSICIVPWLELVSPCICIVPWLELVSPCICIVPWLELMSTCIYIVPWLEQHGTCPVCRSSVDPSAAPQKPPPAARPPEPGPSSRPDQP